MNAKAANGAGSVALVPEFKTVNIKLICPALSSFTIKFVKSNQETQPDFDAAASTTNQWEFVQVVDLDTGATVNGSTGIAVAAAVDRSFEVNTNGMTWFTAIISSYMSGSATLNMRAFFHE